MESQEGWKATTDTDPPAPAPALAALRQEAAEDMGMAGARAVWEGCGCLAGSAGRHRDSDLRWALGLDLDLD